LVDDPLCRHSAIVDDPLYRRSALVDDPLYRRSALIDDPLYKRSALVDDPLDRRSAFVDDILYTRSLTDEPLYSDDLRYQRSLADPLYDPLYRRGLTGDARFFRSFADDPTYTRSYIVGDAMRPRSVLNDPRLYKGSCLDDPLTSGRPAWRYTKWADPNGILDKYLVSGAARADPYYDGWSPLGGPLGRPLARGLH